MAEEEIKKRRKLIVIGGSSGGLEALLIILSLLHKDFTIPVIIVLHRGQVSDGGLIEVLSSKCTLQVKEADEKDMLLPGWIYVAPPDYHLLVEKSGTVSLDVSEKVFYSRPSIEVCFLSAALAFRENLIAVLLSGANADGAEAMGYVKKTGGITIVQDTQDALVPYMPEQAITISPIDMILPAQDIAELLNRYSADVLKNC
ncbi:MAG: chemotaxis protein CheB [Agriterribacter sp.]